MVPFDREWCERSGFQGFVPLRDLEPQLVPSVSGIYIVMREASGPAMFLPTSCGGHFKGKDPTVDVGILESKWVDGCSLVYIGKATSLRKRLRQYRDFGRGRPVGHWGGRYIWQLSDSADLRVAWRVTDGDPRLAEIALLDEFRDQFRRFPFANISS